ncbi:hypothetical protein KPL76_02510 [Subtercola sp. PAMC28395]|uniref:hypothetical protein n=1 Tax=Subtercola sp. PAMC28395 TaxID=2846775 RepID=UPI001C0E7CDD|nr:hypothetical protein [Subtercola sp. PAMC28395]QWT24309.1 hypothetical protein KPL76_02510 [Subtercola sp. PAMC28395]
MIRVLRRAPRPTQADGLDRPQASKQTTRTRPAGAAGLSVKTIALAVGVVYFAGALFVFRDVLFAIPSVLNGTAVIGGDELVPFFNPRSQLLEQAAGQFNELVNGYEFRVRYAFLTTWVRYYKVLPFAILIVIPAMFWGTYLTVARFMDKVFTSLSSQSIYLATAFPVALIYLIMVYSKVTHFYTLILGLVMMTISSMWMLYALLFAGRKWKRYMVLSSFVTLLNPAVHYLILFSLFFGITILVLIVGQVGLWMRLGGPRRLRWPWQWRWRRRWRSPVTVWRESAGGEPLSLRSVGAGLARLRKKITAFTTKASDTVLGRSLFAGVIFVLIAIIPYALFVKYVALAGVTNLSDTVPGDFYFIQDASVSWLHMLSWDLAGITDKILFGDYLAKVPRYPDAVYTVLLFIPLFVGPIRRRLFPTRPHRQLLGVIYVAIAFALWATIGYGEPLWLPTFHRTLAALAITANNSHSVIGNFVVTIAGTIVQVLRFPHRFQLILFMLAPLVMSLTLAWGIDALGRLLTGAPARAAMPPAADALKPDALQSGDSRQGEPADAQAEPVTAAAFAPTDAPVSATGVAAKAMKPARRRRRASTAAERSTLLFRLLATACIASVFFTPFFSNPTYRLVFSSGNMANFLSPFPLGDLKELKTALDALPEGKTAVLPPTETSKLVGDENGIDHKFIDKFFIYYLDAPSFYYGLTGDVKNKFDFFLILRGLYYQQDWWINEARDIGLRYIVVAKNIHTNNGVGAEYLPNVESYVEPALKRLPDQVALRFENKSYALYEITDQAPEHRETLLVDSSWQTYLNLVFTRHDLSRCYKFEYTPYFDPASVEPNSTIHLLTDDVQTSALDLYMLDHPKSISPPDTRMFAFNPDIVASSYYLSPMFRSFLLFSNTKWNRTNVITPGVFGTLRGSFIGVPRATQFSIPVTVPTAGKYHVLMRTAATANTLKISSPGLSYDKTVELRSPPSDLQYYPTASVFSPDRKPVDTSGMSVAQLEAAMPDELTPVNVAYSYQDLGVVDATAGSHAFNIDKTDNNPMLVEGMMLVPEADYESLALPANVSQITNPNDLGCSKVTPITGKVQGYVDPAANQAHLNLTEDQLLNLAAADVQDLVPGTSDEMGPSWLGIAATGLLLVVSALLVRWRSRRRPDLEYEDSPPPEPKE